jgi:WD40 repeat protein
MFILAELTARVIKPGSTDKTARLWNLKTGLCECVVRGHGGMIPSIALAGNQAEGSPSNSNDKEHHPALLAATASGDGVARMWNLSAGGQCWQEMKGWSEGAVNLCAFAPTGLQCSNLVRHYRRHPYLLNWLHMGHLH